MIWIFHREIADAGSCENYDELFKYINLKILEAHPAVQRMPWSFTFVTPQRVSDIYGNTPHSLRTQIIKEAHKKEVGFIAICQGEFEITIEILCTSDIDIEDLKKQWCLAYCKVHDYMVVENIFDHSSSFAQSQWQP